MGLYFAIKTELSYLVSVLETLLGTLGQLSAQAHAIVRQQGGPQLTVAELEQRKAQLLQPFKNFNDEQVRLRWSQYEQKAKDSEAKAEAHLSALKPLVLATVYTRLIALYEKINTPWVWDLPHAKERLKLYEDNLPELNNIRGLLTKEIETKLGRRV